MLTKPEPGNTEVNQGPYALSNDSIPLVPTYCNEGDDVFFPSDHKHNNIDFT